MTAHQTAFDPVLQELPGVASAIPDVVVLMAVYNGMQWLPEQVDTILNQQNVQVSLCISVDQSDDDSYAWCEQLSQKDARVSVLPYGQRFGSATANFFRLLNDTDLENADFIAFADQDDRWYEDKLSRAAELMKRHKLDGYSANVQAFWEDGRQCTIRKSQPQKRWDYFFEAAGPGCTYVLTPSLARYICQVLKDYPEQTQAMQYHDWLCYALARHAGFTWYIDSSVVMDYRQHQQNLIGANTGWRALWRRATKVLWGNALGQARLICKLLEQLPPSRGADQSAHYPTAFRLQKRRDMMRLATMARRCRRRNKDQWLFFIMCVLMSVRGMG